MNKSPTYNVSRLKLEHLVEPLVLDMRTVLQRMQLSLEDLKGGTTGLQGMWRLLDIVSRNRAYDDTHPAFAKGVWARTLPYDGRSYTFYYVDDANDEHVASMLHAVKRLLREKEEKEREPRRVATPGLPTPA
jgi:hypothetical protein